MATTDYGFHTTAHTDAPYTETLNMSTAAAGVNLKTQTVVASGTNTTCYLTANSIPNLSGWVDSRTQTTFLDVSAADSAIRARCKVGRTDGTNSILQEGAFTAYQTLSAVQKYTFSPVAPAWTDGQENVANQFFVVWEFNNTNTMFSKAVTYRNFSAGVVTDDSYITADLEVSTRRIMSIV